MSEYTILGKMAAPTAKRAPPDVGILGRKRAGHVMTYDTPLSDTEEREFQSWKKKHAPKDSGFDYDLRGAFKAGAKADPKTNHWPDTFKKPNHPTFSDQSQYAKTRPDLAGSWEGDRYIPAKKKASK